MKTNKPGTVTQQPLFGCASCYDDVSYPADHLHVYNGECWCENCWEYATHEIADGRDWSELEPFKPALQAECEKLRKDADRYRWLRRGGNDDIGVVMGFDGIDCGSTSVAYTYEEGLCGERMDAAIDAAMQEENK